MASARGCAKTQVCAVRGWDLAGRRCSWGDFHGPVRDGADPGRASMHLILPSEGVMEQGRGRSPGWSSSAWCRSRRAFPGHVPVATARERWRILQWRGPRRLSLASSESSELPVSSPAPHRSYYRYRRRHCRHCRHHCHRRHNSTARLNGTTAQDQRTRVPLKKRASASRPLLTLSAVCGLRSQPAGSE